MALSKISQALVFSVDSFLRVPWHMIVSVQERDRHEETTRLYWRSLRLNRHVVHDF